MSRNSDMAFGRGETFYMGRAIDTNNLEGAELEGTEKLFEDINYGSTETAKPRRSNGRVRAVIMRNMSGVAILPKEVVHVDTANRNRIDGKVKTAAEARPVVVDEYVGAAGVPHGDLFWAVVEGPALVKNSVAQAVAITVGGIVVAATGSAASTAAAATTNEHGRVNAQVLAAPTDAGSTTTFTNQLRNQIGTALTARTTGETNADVLVDMKLLWR